MSTKTNRLLKPLDSATVGAPPVMVEVFVSGKPSHADAEAPGVYALSIDPTLRQDHWADAAVGALCIEARITRPRDFTFSVVADEITLHPRDAEPDADVSRRATYLFKLCD